MRSMKFVRLPGRRKDRIDDKVYVVRIEIDGVMMTMHLFFIFVNKSTHGQSRPMSPKHSIHMQFLLRILLIPLILALHGIDGRIHVQPVACSEAISHLNDISSLDYLIDIQQLDDDDEDRASISGK